MAREKKTKPTLDMLFFSTPEQKVLRFLAGHPTTSFTPRVISSKLKGVRGLGGMEGIMKIMKHLSEMGLVDFLDNGKSIRLRDESSTIKIFKTFLALCDLEGLVESLSPLSTKGILFGSRAEGRYRTDSNYNLFVVTDQVEEAKRISAQHPMGKDIDIFAWTPGDYEKIEEKNPGLASKLAAGILMWGSNW